VCTDPGRVAAHDRGDLICPFSSGSLASGREILGAANSRPSYVGSKGLAPGLGMSGEKGIRMWEPNRIEPTESTTTDEVRFDDPR
jgi:hypothetical protein